MTIKNAATELDRLIKAHTSFQDWTDLMDAVVRGYVPTIHKPRKGGEQRLVRMLVARGVKVYTGAR